mmetsp:Transcript_46818/g.93785  ORF Transcript_46818/g.93785 Transcript_46818/m.93785 type:complete len:200 (-) Transcript_46818:445-1044(-)
MYTVSKSRSCWEPAGRMRLSFVNRRAMRSRDCGSRAASDWRWCRSVSSWAVRSAGSLPVACVSTRSSRSWRKASMLSAVGRTWGLRSVTATEFLSICADLAFQVVISSEENTSSGFTNSGSPMHEHRGPASSFAGPSHAQPSTAERRGSSSSFLSSPSWTESAMPTECMCSLPAAAGARSSFASSDVVRAALAMNGFRT